jgi:hypothetical protein
MLRLGSTHFQQDGAPSHKAWLVTGWLQSQNIDALFWPGQSPDLNPTENLWMTMEKYVAFRNLFEVKYSYTKVRLQP